MGQPLRLFFVIDWIYRFKLERNSNSLPSECIRPPVHEEKELLTVLKFPFRVGTPSLAKIDSLSSRIKPFLEMSLEALEHLFFDVFDIGEPAPASDIAVLR